MPRFLILGAGPAGLSFAHRLLEHGIHDFLVLEKESEAGGLWRGAMVDGSPLDISGGHFLDVRRPAVTDFLFRFMPVDEWNLFHRDSRIRIHGTDIGSPIEANIWQLPEAIQRRYLRDIAEAGCNTGAPKPTRFVEWIAWKLGRGIAEDYMLPYNRKMFGEDLNALGTYWLEKLPNVSYEETRRSCAEHRPYGAQPGHAVFYYPKSHGGGEVFRRMAEALGDRLLLDTPVRTLDVATRTVNGDLHADVIVNTVPWTAFEHIDGLSAAAEAVLPTLRHVGIRINYVADAPDTPAHWLYLPDPAIPEHRRLLRANFLPGAKGYWTETRIGRDTPAAPDAPSFLTEYAYPLNTIGKNEAMDLLLAELRSRSVIGLGRWGHWQHYNTDPVVEKSLALADELA